MKNSGIRLFLPFFITMIAVGLVGYYVASAGWYPVAMVEGNMVSARALHETERFIGAYYARAEETYGILGGSVTNAITPAEIRRATLDKLIENRFLAVELQELHGNGADTLVARKLNASGTDAPGFADAVRTIYGLSLERFTETVLIPQAHEELVREAFADAGREYGEWLTGVRASADVRVFAPGFMWVGGQVQFK
jgi:hypothetical protein